MQNHAMKHNFSNDYICGIRDKMKSNQNRDWNQGINQNTRSDANGNIPTGKKRKRITNSFGNIADNCQETNRKKKRLRGGRRGAYNRLDASYQGSGNDGSMTDRSANNWRKLKTESLQETIPIGLSTKIPTSPHIGPFSQVDQEVPTSRQTDKDNCTVSSDNLKSPRPSTSSQTAEEGRSSTFSISKISAAIDVDYDDEIYDLPKVKKGKSKREIVTIVPAREIAAEREALSQIDVIPTNTDVRGASTGGLPGFKGRIGFLRSKDFESLIYKPPPNEGIPEKDIESIPKDKDYWALLDNKLEDKDFTPEEIMEGMMSKAQKIASYFSRLELNQLTEEEVQDIRPKNFRGPYLPKPQHIAFLETLDIEVNWDLSPLHSYILENMGLFGFNQRLKKGWMEYDLRNATREETQSMLFYWIKFQKEYKFYDLRPLTRIKTARLDLESMTVKQFDYLSNSNYVKFFLYVGRDLPKRTISFIRNRLATMLVEMNDNVVDKRPGRVTARLLAQLEFVLKVFAGRFIAAELLIDDSHYYLLRSTFQRFFFERLMKIRVGTWIPAEKDRLVKGVLETCKVDRLEEAVKLRINWCEVLPYIRTRKSSNCRPKLNSILADNMSTPFIERQKLCLKLILLIYESDVNSFSMIDWKKVADILDLNNVYLPQSLFRNMYYRVVHNQCQNSFEEAITYLYTQEVPKKLTFLGMKDLKSIQLKGHILKLPNLEDSKDPDEEARMSNNLSVNDEDVEEDEDLELMFASEELDMGEDLDECMDLSGEDFEGPGTSDSTSKNSGTDNKHTSSGNSRSKKTESRDTHRSDSSPKKSHNNSKEKKSTFSVSKGGLQKIVEEEEEELNDDPSPVYQETHTPERQDGTEVRLEKTTRQPKISGVKSKKSSGKLRTRFASPKLSFGEQLQSYLSPNSSSGEPTTSLVSPSSSSGVQIPSYLTPKKSSGEQRTSALSPKSSGKLISIYLNPKKASGEPRISDLNARWDTGEPIPSYLNPKKSSGLPRTSFASPDLSSGEPINPKKSFGKAGTSGVITDKPIVKKKNSGGINPKTSTAELTLSKDSSKKSTVKLKKSGKKSKKSTIELTVRNDSLEESMEEFTVSEDESDNFDIKSEISGVGSKKRNLKRKMSGGTRKSSKSKMKLNSDTLKIKSKKKKKMKRSVTPMKLVVTEQVHDDNPNDPSIKKKNKKKKNAGKFSIKSTVKQFNDDTIKKKKNSVLTLMNSTVDEPLIDDIPNDFTIKKIKENKGVLSRVKSFISEHIIDDTPKKYSLEKSSLKSKKSGLTPKKPKFKNKISGVQNSKSGLSSKKSSRESEMSESEKSSENPENRGTSPKKSKGKSKKSTGEPLVDGVNPVNFTGQFGPSGMQQGYPFTYMSGVHPMMFTRQFGMSDVQQGYPYQVMSNTTTKTPKEQKGMSVAQQGYPFPVMSIGNATPKASTSTGTSGVQQAYPFPMMHIAAQMPVVQKGTRGIQQAYPFSRMTNITPKTPAGQQGTSGMQQGYPFPKMSNVAPKTPAGQQGYPFPRMSNVAPKTPAGQQGTSGMQQGYPFPKLSNVAPKTPEGQQGTSCNQRGYPFPFAARVPYGQYSFAIINPLAPWMSTGQLGTIGTQLGKSHSNDKNELTNNFYQKAISECRKSNQGDKKEENMPVSTKKNTVKKKKKKKREAKQK